MKSVIRYALVSFWLFLNYFMDTLGDVLSSLSGLANWQMLGWAFGGSTVFVVYEAIEGKQQRKGWQRIAMIGMGMFVAMGFNESLSALEIGGKHLDLKVATILLAVLGYIGLGKLITRARKAKTLQDIKDLTKLDDD